MRYLLLLLAPLCLAQTWRISPNPGDPINVGISGTSGSGAPSNPCGAVTSTYTDTAGGVMYFCPSNGSNWVSTGTPAAGSVTLAMMANLPANTFIGNNTGSSATPLALTVAQMQTALSVPALPVTVANGGTSLATLTAHALYVGNTTSAPNPIAVGATNAPLIGQTGADPIFSTILYPSSLTSGGVICATSTTQMASGALLGANLPVIGGGAGACPTTGTVTGTGTQFVLAAGGPIITGQTIHSNTAGSSQLGLKDSTNNKTYSFTNNNNKLDIVDNSGNTWVSINTSGQTNLRGSVGIGPSNTSPTGTLDVTDKTASTGATRVNFGLGAADSASTVILTVAGSQTVAGTLGVTGLGTFTVSPTITNTNAASIQNLPIVCAVDRRTAQSATITAAALQCNGGNPPAGTYLIMQTGTVTSGQTGTGNITSTLAWTENGNAISNGTVWNGALSLGAAAGTAPSATVFSQSGTKIIEHDGTSAITYTITYTGTGQFDTTTVLMRLR